jgi:hypothetical protein
VKRREFVSLLSAHGDRALIRNVPISWHFERDAIPYALETDWPAEAGGFEPLHFGIRSAAVDHGLRLSSGRHDKLQLRCVGSNPAAPG